MEVVCNHFNKVCSAGTGQWHNSLVLSTMKPNAILFNNIIYPCKWSRTIGADGQWEEITFFNRRHSRSGVWATEHYVRVRKGLWILQYRTPSDRQQHHETLSSIFYDVPFKLLRVMSCGRSAIMQWSAAAEFDSSDIGASSHLWSLPAPR